MRLLCGENGTRTRGLLYAIQTRYQLRHIPIKYTRTDFALHRLCLRAGTCGGEGIRTLLELLAKQVPYPSSHTPRCADGSTDRPMTLVYTLPDLGQTPVRWHKEDSNLNGRMIYSQFRISHALCLAYAMKESNLPSRMTVDLQSTPLPLRYNDACISCVRLVYHIGTAAVN